MDTIKDVIKLTLVPPPPPYAPTPTVSRRIPLSSIFRLPAPISFKPKKSCKGARSLQDGGPRLYSYAKLLKEVEGSFVKATADSGATLSSLSTAYYYDEDEDKTLILNDADLKLAVDLGVRKFFVQQQQPVVAATVPPSNKPKLVSTGVSTLSVKKPAVSSSSTSTAITKMSSASTSTIPRPIAKSAGTSTPRSITKSASTSTVAEAATSSSTSTELDLWRPKKGARHSPVYMLRDTSVKVFLPNSSSSSSPPPAPSPPMYKGALVHLPKDTRTRAWSVPTTSTAKASVKAITPSSAGLSSRVRGNGGQQGTDTVKGPSTSNNTTTRGRKFSSAASADESYILDLIFKANKKQQTHDEIKVHHRHTCDGCNQHPIIGRRYNSKVLDDYDLCESCYTESTNSSILKEEDSKSKKVEDVWSIYEGISQKQKKKKKVVFSKKKDTTPTTLRSTNLYGLQHLVAASCNSCNNASSVSGSGSRSKESNGYWNGEPNSNSSSAAASSPPPLLIRPPQQEQPKPKPKPPKPASAPSSPSSFFSEIRRTFLETERSFNIVAMRAVKELEEGLMRCNSSTGFSNFESAATTTDKKKKSLDDGWDERLIEEAVRRSLIVDTKVSKAADAAVSTSSDDAPKVNTDVLATMAELVSRRVVREVMEEVLAKIYQEERERERLGEVRREIERVKKAEQEEEEEEEEEELERERNSSGGSSFFSFDDGEECCKDFEAYFGREEEEKEGVVFVEDEAEKKEKEDQQTITSDTDSDWDFIEDEGSGRLARGLSFVGNSLMKNSLTMAEKVDEDDEDEDFDDFVKERVRSNSTSSSTPTQYYGPLTQWEVFASGLTSKAKSSSLGGNTGALRKYAETQEKFCFFGPLTQWEVFASGLKGKPRSSSMGGEELRKFNTLTTTTNDMFFGPLTQWELFAQGLMKKNGSAKSSSLGRLCQT